MAIRPQQDLGLGPVLADFADQAAQMCSALSSFRAARGTQQSTNQPPVPVKDDHGLEAVFVTVRVEQAQLTKQAREHPEQVCTSPPSGVEIILGSSV